MFRCEHCSLTFTRRDNLKRHADHKHNVQKDLTCIICEMKFQNIRVLQYHILKSHNMEKEKTTRRITKVQNNSIQEIFQHVISNNKDQQILCKTCNIIVEKSKYTGHVKSGQHKNFLIDCNDTVEITETAFQNRIITYRVYGQTVFVNIEDFLVSVLIRVKTLLIKQLELLVSLKLNCEFYGLYVKEGNEGKATTDVKSFNTKNVTVCLSTDLMGVLEKFQDVIICKSEEFQESLSGWTLQEVLFLEVNINKHCPLYGSSYIDLPKEIKFKKAIVNVQNNDKACFAWAVVSALYPAMQHSNRTSSYPHYTKVLKLENIAFPVTLKSIKRFEDMNNVSINVYGLENGMVIGPLHHTVCKKEVHVNLLYIENQGNSHYCWIKNLSRLTDKQLSKREHKKWLCDGCLIYFRNEDKLKLHQVSGCNKICTIVPDPENNKLKFKNYQHKLRIPFIIYADFKSIPKPIKTCLRNPNLPYTENIELHEPVSFAYLIKCSYNDELSKFQTYREFDCAKMFVQKLRCEVEEIANIFKFVVPIRNLSKDEQIGYENSQTCHICGKLFTEVDYKVKDHCHVSGNYRGPAHRSCNLNYQIPDFVPVVCHNLTVYNAHFIIKELGYDSEKIDLLPENKERYISFTKYIRLLEGKVIKLRFIDSFRFLSSTIEEMARNLQHDQLYELRKYFPNVFECDMLKDKPPFPYNFVESIDQLSILSLYTKNDEHIADETEYNKAQCIWDTFHCSTVGDFLDLYLKVDVVLLTDVFENYRDLCINTYELDPAYYYTAAGLSWNAMLKCTMIEMELLTDIDMVNFVKKGIRGGLSQCSKRYSQANNKHMWNYDSKQESVYLVYLDANNLYGWAMTQCLPHSNFRWLTASEVENFNVKCIDDTSKKGYILDVDLAYPTTLENLHSDLPFCVENSTPPYITSIETKLIANLLNKNHYIIHYRNLKQTLENGLVLKKIHTILEFSQSPWLKPYIDKNTNLRAQANTEFEKNFYKLMNNSVFGKTMENVDKRVDVKLITHWSNIGKKYGANKLISKPNFHSRSVFNENLVAIQMKRTKVTYNKPIYIGFCVLDISKLLMYDFHYNSIKSKYGNNAKLLYTDTDSLIYEIQTEDFYEEMLKTNLEKFDTSNYPINNKFNIPLVNNKVLGKFKDECAGKLLLEFVGTKAKSYCTLVEGAEEIKKIKGVSKNVVASQININDFKECLVNNQTICRSMKIFKSNKHLLYTQLQNKVALNSSDDKRFVIPNSYDTLPWGHSQIDYHYFT